MCPALILAANRKDSVIGRTEILIVSICTKKGLSQSGAPDGNKLAAKEEGLYINLDIISASHKGSPIVKVNTKCLENLKV